MNWAEPTWGLLLGVVLTLAVVTWVAGTLHLRRLRAAFGEGHVLDRVLPPWMRLRRRVRDGLALTGLALLVVALAEPRFGKTLREVKAEGVDLVLAVDLSRSMDAGDVDPSRLERARREILDLVELLAGDRVGLVTYAAGAWPRMPLTLDYRALDLVVRELDTRTFQAQGSSLGPALAKAVELLTAQPSDAGRAVLVLSDGEVHDEKEALDAARKAAAAGVTVYGLVIGTEASPIPNDEGTALGDPNTGVEILTTPSTEVLTEIARITGGAVVRSVPGNDDVIALYAGEIRNKLRVAVGRTSHRESWNSAFQWPLGLGLLALLVAGWLGDGRRGALALVALLALAPLPARAQTVQDADHAYREGRYDEAVRLYTDLSLQRPDDADLYERLGAARYRAGDYTGAARAWERSAELARDPDALYNAGNAYARSGQLDRAVQRYDEVLAAEPEHTGANQNRRAVEQEIRRRRELQQQQQQQGGSGDESQPQQEPQPGQGRPQQPGEPSPPQPSDPGQQGEQPPQGQPQPGDPSQDPSQDRGQQQGSPDDGTRKEDRRDDGQVGLDEVQDPTGDAPEGDPVPGPTHGGRPSRELTPEQASRTLEGVEEGSPRVYLPGPRSDKPW